MKHDDIDPLETQEWLDALESVLDNEGEDRAHYLMTRLGELASRSGTPLPYAITTPYRNTIPVTHEARMPGDLFMERRIRSLVRWNALAMVMRTNQQDPDLGGHISTFASSATLYDIGFNYFFKAPTEEHGGDLVFFQGHASPGIYARAFMEGRISEEQMENFRQEVDGKGLSSYPHPWLMPDFWQFPTVSMGLGPIQAIYQARFMKYLEHRGFIEPGKQKVWCFVGDGETDEPETLGAISLAGREKLDNLIFVINCNLQRLDGPVRGNGKIIQELEGSFRGADWNVIKVIWGRMWDPLFAKDDNGLLQQRMEEAVDGDYQNYKAKDGAFVREHFFGTRPELKEMVKDLSDEEIWKLNRGGHDPYKVYAAYHEAVNHEGQPSVILAKTIKGYGTGAGQGQNTAHNTKKVDIDSLKKFRDRFDIPVNDDELEKLPFFKPEEGSAEYKYLHARREALGGYMPQRRVESKRVPVPPLDTLKAILDGTGDREISTTMAFVRILSQLVKDKELGPRIVPIVPDEARTFGMEGMFRQLGIYSSVGQLYEPVDKDQVMFYREDKKGQILEEGINEAGAMSSWIAAGTAYSTHNQPMLPFYIFYSMFGFQRIGDLAWAAGDSRAKGFLIGGTAGRTTLNGEGLQHEDGHSHLLASTIPNCRSYDPTYGYELAVIIREGARRMMEEQENVYYYLTVMNEAYTQPAMPKGKGVEDGIMRGMYLLDSTGKPGDLHVQLMGSGTILREVREAAAILKSDFGVSADIWSVTSFNELRRDGLAVERDNRLHPTRKPKTSFVEQCLDKRQGPVIAATDYMKLYADQIRQWVPAPYKVLGTDGFGRSDSRRKLRHFFEVDRHWVAYTALSALVEQGKLKPKVLTDALKAFGLDADKPNPLDC
ncbi:MULTISPECIES: pyruvate dehydrogenase (acetyl-transferring), homodimeric type [Halopseudomonas]|jgi:pyruvate dehydrogenase E1 component|uniref:Pyruvate dehydrogenase E1 component n=1 Tax=Halopseudomonas aestusnigri TaxID=857252 RepID=A0AAQ1G780_9GAMM|nr:pyruvate dehydrogenase (acetyl-transferring), homodimeric type [Halopseudomonas aestusnigri]MAD27928.1 pyruvate dehydrogenase (acetyl-transferring), homodimeric type [Pseudomonadales bacterium]MEE2797944.1 pyruvate dehydrogenase (acetyl-transferring), homodimeric type [Pseudomonadota bacterium]MAS65835.1 pyruvate dehydrogenase (acetyl-transferring), homodimeric type [Pseudomonadales bacterium]MCC4260191.1 pyruvate dehydrogenase (acetyl-transferring), homodimeric type [Halopseudomonas aestusn|tara:strand:- start:1803 stop:4460 length:2658 start_codon:yes stop_codon:yes gene_type:complete